MFDRLKNLLRVPEAKTSRTAQLIQFETGGRARWTPRDYAALAREGYVCNAIVHRAVKLVAENVAAATYLVYEGAVQRDPHPLLDLLARPNPRQEGAAFLEGVCAHLCWPATPTSRRCRSRAKVRPACASFMRCGPTACVWCRAPTAGRRRMTT